MRGSIPDACWYRSPSASYTLHCSSINELVGPEPGVSVVTAIIAIVSSGAVGSGGQAGWTPGRGRRSAEPGIRRLAVQALPQRLLMARVENFLRSEYRHWPEYSRLRPKLASVRHQISSRPAVAGSRASSAQAALIAARSSSRPSSWAAPTARWRRHCGPRSQASSQAWPISSERRRV